MNAAYQAVIHEFFPKFESSLRFYILQLAAFHQTSLDPKCKQPLAGLKEYVTQPETINIAFDPEGQNDEIYDSSLSLMVIKKPAALANLLTTYEPSDTAMDMKLAVVSNPYSNGLIELVKRLSKLLKRSCSGFKNQLNFLKRIYQMTA